MFEQFESIHKNHKLAYLDGLLCGLVAYHYVSKAVRNYRESQATLVPWEDTDVEVRIIPID